MNQNILRELKILAQEATSFRKQAFLKAYKIISDLDYPVKDPENLPLGKGIKDRIREIIENGQLKETEDFSEREDLEQVWGIGPVSAQYLREQGVREIADLSKPEYFELLTEKQKRGLFYHQDFSRPIKRETAVKIVEETFSLFKEFSRGKEKIVVAGSYRRGKVELNDLDFIIQGSVEFYKEFIAFLYEKEFLHETLAFGDRKFLGVVQLKKRFFRIDFIQTELLEFPFALLYFTGGKDYVKRLRAKAKKMGYSLNEFSLKNSNRIFASEEEILDFLGEPYLSPEKRIS